LIADPKTAKENGALGAIAALPVAVATSHLFSRWSKKRLELVKIAKPTMARLRHKLVNSSTNVARMRLLMHWDPIDVRNTLSVMERELAPVMASAKDTVGVKLLLMKMVIRSLRSN